MLTMGCLFDMYKYVYVHVEKGAEGVCMCGCQRQDFFFLSPNCMLQNL